MKKAEKIMECHHRQPLKDRRVLGREKKREGKGGRQVQWGGKGRSREGKSGEQKGREEGESIGGKKWMIGEKKS